MSPSPACSALPGLPGYRELAGMGRVSLEPAVVGGETGGLWWARGCWTLPGHPLVGHVEKLHVLLGWRPCLWPAVCALGGQHCGRWCPQLLLGCLVGVPLSLAVPTWELGSPVLEGTLGCGGCAPGGCWMPAATSALRHPLPCGLGVPGEPVPDADRKGFASSFEDGHVALSSHEGDIAGAATAPALLLHPKL